MNYSFNMEIAKEAGVEEAVMLENIYYWILKNKANNKHFYDGNYWTYNSIKAFEELFPFWSKKQIARILKNLEVNDFIVTGNYNKVAYDRTRWYALTEKALSIFPNGEMDLPKRGNGEDHLGKSNCLNGEIELTKQENRIDQKGKPIPNINTNINTDINNIYSHWNSKNIINHKELTKEIESAINKALKNYKEKEIINAIDTYKEILDSAFYFNYKWNLKDFLTRKNGISTFTSEGSNKVNYEDWRISQNGTNRNTKPGQNTSTKKYNVKIESNNELTDEERARAEAELI